MDALKSNSARFLIAVHVCCGRGSDEVRVMMYCTLLYRHALGHCILI